MPGRETFELATDGAPVTGAVVMQGAPLSTDRRPIALVTDAGLNAPVDAWGVAEALSEGLAAAGFAVASFDWPEIGPASSTTAADCVAHAERVVTWLIGREDLDPQRLTIAGTGVGGMIAASLAGRCEMARAVALARPLTAAALTGRNGRSATEVPLIDPSALTGAFLESLAHLAPEAELARHEHPTLLLSGACDRAAPPEAAAPYLDALEGAEREVSFELVAMAREDSPVVEIGPIVAERIARFFVEIIAPAKAGAA